MPDELEASHSVSAIYNYELEQASCHSLAATIVVMVQHADIDSLSEVLESLLMQSMQNFKVFIVIKKKDEADVSSILEEISFHGYVKVELILDEADLLRKALLKSPSSYTCWLDARFILAPTYLEKCMWFLAVKPSNLAFCNTMVRCKYNENMMNISPQDAYRYVEMSSETGQSIVIKQEILKQALGSSASTSLTLVELLLLLAKHDSWGETLPEYLCCYKSLGGGLATEGAELPISTDYSGILNNVSKSISKERGAYDSIAFNFPFENALVADEVPRYLFILPWMVTGGADKFNLDLLEMLVNRGCKVSICTTVEGNHVWESRFKAFTSDIFVLDRFIEYADFPRFISYMIQSRKVGAVMISGSQLAYQLLPYLRAESPDTVFVDLNHVEEPDWQNGGHPRFGVGYQDLLDINMVSTEHLASWMVQRGADENRIRTLYTGVDEYSDTVIKSNRVKVREEMDIDDATPIIIFGGRICQQKRPLMLAEILDDLYSHGGKFHVFVVGDGDQRALFEEKINQTGLHQHVTMFGAVEHNRWISLLQASDIFLLPSEYEGISIALLEAMATGVVPVVSDVGGQREIVREGSGFIIPILEGEEKLQYMEYLKTLLSNIMLRQKMSKQSRKLIEQYFSKKTTIASFEKNISEARGFLNSKPRVIIPLGFAKELVVAAIENHRLNNAVQWLWNKSSSGTDAGGLIEVINFLRSLRKNKFISYLMGISVIRHMIYRLLK